MPSVNKMCQQPVAQLGFKPGAFGRHHIAAVGNIEQLLYADRVKAESHFHLPAVHAFFQFAEAADATYEINPFVGTLVFNAQ